MGSISGLVYVFALPAMVYIKQSEAAGTLTPMKKYAHYGIIVIGVANLIAQFVI